MRLLSLILVLLILPQTLLAEVVVRSPFYFPVQSADYKSLLESYDPLKDLANSRIELMQILSPYKSSIENMDVMLSATHQLLVSQEIGKLSYVVNVSRVQLNTGKVATNDVIQQVVGGSTFNIRINASCSSMHVESKDAALKLNVDVEAVADGGHIQLKLKNFEILGEAQWTVSSQGCEGPVGYQEQVEKAVANFLQNRESLKKVLSERLQSSLNGLGQSMSEKLLKVKSVALMDGVRFILKPQGVDADGGSLMLFGEVETVMDSAKNIDHFISAPISKTELAQVQKSGLIISQSYIKEVFKHLFEEGHLKYKFSSSGIQALKNFMNNRFMQFFLWPDLLKFAKGAEFLFKASSQGAPDVNYIQSSKGYAWYNLKNLVGVDMMAPQGAGHIPYVNFQANVDVNSWMTVANNRMYVGFSQPASNLSALWDSNYLQNFKPKKSVNTSMINGALKKAVKDYRFDISLPVLDLNSMFLKPAALQPSAQWLQLVYKPAAK